MACPEKEITYYLPWPPSTNSLWRAVKGRNILSARARAWSNDASKHLLAQKAKPILGEVEVIIRLCPPNKRIFDLDNRVKAVLDSLVMNGIIEDDSILTLKRITVGLDTGFMGAMVSICQWDDNRGQEPTVGRRSK